MTDLGEVLELMHTSSRRWRTLRLEGFEWRHGPRLTQAFHDHFEALRRSGASISSVRAFAPVDGRPVPDESVGRWRVWLEAPDRRRAQFGVGDVMVTAVFRGGSWWSVSPMGFHTNDGAPNSSHGFGPADALIEPSRYTSSVQLGDARRTSFLSRPPFHVTATPVTPVGSVFGHVLHAWGTGADEYTLEVDVEAGVLLRCEARRQGEAFRVVEADAIGMDEQLDPRLFDPELLRSGVTDV